MNGVALAVRGPAAPPSPSRGLLRVLTCGSVDDGKSTLIGRLLCDAGAIPDDQMAALARDSRRHGTTGDDLDLALLADGLEAERQQGITIDVAYRFFSTARRSYILADTPGHEQYTRNMATGASGADFAIILVDARKGILTQTRRHAHICSLMGIRHVAVAVNKIDLVGFSQSIFSEIVQEFSGLAERLGFRSVLAVPVSARFGHNVSALSEETPWYKGPALLPHLDAIDTSDDLTTSFRFPVQYVNRPDADFRGVSGTVAGGRIKVGDRLAVASSGQVTEVARIVTADGDRDAAIVGDAVTLTMKGEVDIARGDVLSHSDDRPDVADQFAAHVLWMGDVPLAPGQQYLLRTGHAWTQATVLAIRHKIDVNTMKEEPAGSLAANEIAVCHFSTARPIAIDPYTDNRTTGACILVDRHSNATAGAAMILAPLRRAANIHPEHFLVDGESRAAALGQRPAILWFTGLSGAGKSTIAKLTERKLHQLGRHTYSMDGDNLRHGLNRDLGFSDADRVENIRRAGEAARLLLDAGLIVLCSFISPFRADRDLVREMVRPGEFFEIFVDTPLDECERRDAKGLYAKARAGEITNFTGVGSNYERPLTPDVVLHTLGRAPEDVADELVRLLGDFRP